MLAFYASRVRHQEQVLISSGSAIAAVAPSLNASQDEIAVSLEAVFVLNPITLLTFPAIGTALHMTQTQFGLWSALATPSRDQKHHQFWSSVYMALP